LAAYLSKKPIHRSAGTPFSFIESPTMSTTASTILVVEDDQIVRMLIVDVLEELAFKVLEAKNGQAALELVQDRGQTIDLLMTDVGLPDIDGKKLAIQAQGFRPQLQVLFASGYAENLVVPDGMHLIAKPFSIDQLRDKVSAILALRSQAPCAR